MTDAPKTDSSTLITAKQRTQLLARHHGLHAVIEAKTAESTYSQRASARQKLELARRQKNLEQILARAERLCSDEASSALDPDWFNAYLDLAQDSQNKQMQLLWAQILAQEIVTPGRFSIRALRTLTLMTQREALCLQRAVQLASRMGGEQNHKILVGALRQPPRLGLSRARLRRLGLGHYRLAYSQIMELSELGLIYDRELESSFAAELDLSFEQGGTMWLLRPRTRGCKLLYYRFTPIGDELAQLIEASPIDSYQQDLSDLLNEFYTLAH